MNVKKEPEHHKPVICGLGLGFAKFSGSDSLTHQLPKSGTGLGNAAR